MKLPLLCAAALALPTLSFAAGSDSSEPPAETKTITQCTGGQVFDEKSGACVDVKSDLLDDDALYRAVREFAYAGQFGAAERALDAMTDQRDDRVLTYRGFLNRKLGQRDAAMSFYQAALAQNPDNILARSYMAQGLVEEGDFVAAWGQLKEIRARGGAGTWAEASLIGAIERGTGYNH